MARVQEIRDYCCFIDGQWRPSISGEYFEATDPFTAKPWARIPRCDARDVDLAVSAARAALERGEWASYM
jgi:acyl-CoA reductase-like NAD-dependent aldehyde dehydrogenase